MSDSASTQSTTPAQFRQRGGYRVGWSSLIALNATWPFGCIDVRRDELVLGCIVSRLVFPRPAVTRLSIYREFISAGLRIEHTLPQYSRFVLFWSPDLRELQRQLTEFGYEVQ